MYKETIIVKLRVLVMAYCRTELETVTSSGFVFCVHVDFDLKKVKKKIIIEKRDIYICMIPKAMNLEYKFFSLFYE